MATTFTLIYLGSAPDLDTVEGNLAAENASALNGLVFGSASDPIAKHLATLAPGSTGYAGGNSTAYDPDNTESFTLDGGAQHLHDAAMLYTNTVIRYTDGTTATVQAIVMQDTSGKTYLLPPQGPTADDNSTALTAKPIESVTLGTAARSGGSDVFAMTADRYVITPHDYIIKGTAGDDSIAAAYTGDPEGDRVDNSDALDSSNSDTVLAGAGDDAVFAGPGNDAFFGGTGNDTLDGGATGDDDHVVDLRAYGHRASNVLYDPLHPKDGSVEFLDSNGSVSGALAFSNIEQVTVCITPGARILTNTGEVAVERLRAGDLVLTRDNGYQPIIWIGHRDLSQAELIAAPRFNPVRIAAGSLGPDLPERDMTVSPQHRMLITSSRSELLFGEHEVLVAARHLTHLNGINRFRPKRVSYIHFMFENHEILRADGTWTESFQPGAQTLAGLGAAPRAEILALFPELASGASYAASRMTLKAREARVLIRA